MELNPKLSKPLYVQVRERILKDVEFGNYKKGEAIPTEPELCQIYEVSRNTIRNAVKSLVNDNLLIKKQGKGTFVQNDKITSAISKRSRAKSFTDICKEAGQEAGSKVIKSVIELACEQDVLTLGIQPEDHVIVLERIRYADDTPVSVEVTRFTERFQFLMEEDLNGKRSMYRILEDKYDIVLEVESIELELTYASYEIAHYLSVHLGHPLLKLFSVQHEKGAPVCISTQFTLGDKVKVIV
jgi:GntR family transcriptional regulator